MKSLARCEESVKFLLPSVRAEVARVLISNYSMSESQAATLLGVSQASVSHYLSGERAREQELTRPWAEDIHRFAESMAEALVSGKSIDQISASYCELCRKVGIGLRDESQTII
ncbi:MAG: transcriptional regulator [Thermoprotei archaeon]|nr:hypothetical protein [TACK group archaeon]